MKRLLRIYGRAVPYAFVIFSYYTFMLAYFHPAKKVIISIDTLGEANIELIMFLIFIPLMIWSLKPEVRKSGQSR